MREEAPDDLPRQDEQRLSLIRPALELFQRSTLGDHLSIWTFPSAYIRYHPALD